MDKPMRVLQAVVANDKGGLTGYVCQNYRFIDKDKVQFDFITYDEILDFEDEFTKLGAKFYRFPRANHIFNYYRQFKAIQKEMNYSTIHFHMSYANIVPLCIAKLVGIKNIIMHSHSTEIDSGNIFVRTLKNIFHSICKNLLGILANQYLACSTDAALWMFPSDVIKNKKYILCKNAIEVSKFNFDESLRLKKRKELFIEDEEHVVGHVGRFTYQKNHEFIIDVFEQLVKINDHVKLILIGDGPLKSIVEKRVNDLKLTDKIVFLGQRSDVPQLLQVMDCFILPSNFEGLPIVGIEAQAAGLPCFFSDGITKEVGVTSIAKFLPINDVELWATALTGCKLQCRERYSQIVNEAGYDIKEEIKKIEDVYMMGLVYE